jgi:hypothetical protein
MPQKYIPMWCVFNYFTKIVGQLATVPRPKATYHVTPLPAPKTPRKKILDQNKAALFANAPNFFVAPSFANIMTQGQLLFVCTEGQHKGYVTHE